jgi:hypothetical protein
MFHLWDPSDPAMNYKFGEAISLVCVIVSYVVSTQLSHNPRMFTVMALLTCVWSLVMGRYIGRDSGTLSLFIGDIASFLLVYIGGLLAQGSGAKTVSWLQRLALLLLLLIVLARPIDMPAQLEPFFGKLSPTQSRLILSLCLDLAAFLAVGFGAHAIARGRLFVTLAVILAAYGCLQITSTITHWTDVDSSRPPEGILLISLAAFAKLAFTGVFSCIVLQYATSRASPTTPLPAL